MDVIFAPDWQDETGRKRLAKSLARMGVLHTEIENLHAGVIQCLRRPDVIDVGSLVPLIAVLIRRGMGAPARGSTWTVTIPSRRHDARRNDCHTLDN